MQRFDIENRYDDVTDQLIPVVNYRMKRQRSLKFLLLSYLVNMFIIIAFFIIGINNITKELRLELGDLFVPLICYEVDIIIWESVNIGYIYSAIKSEIEDSSKKLLFNFKLQFLVKIARLFFPWFIFMNSFSKPKMVLLNIIIINFIISQNIQVFSQLFFLILSFINSSNNYTLTFNKNHLIVPRNIISNIFISMMMCFFAISLFGVIYIGFVFSDYIYLKNKYLIISSVIIMFLSYIIKIIIDNRMTDKNKRMGPYYHGTFFILRFFPAIYLMIYFDFSTNVITLVATNYMTNIVMMDYFINH